MDDLLTKYKNDVLTNANDFISREAKKFPSNYSDKDKVKSEFMSIHSFYHDKNSNEGYFDSNQEIVIQQALDEIKELIDQKDFDTAKYYIVSLELLMGMEVNFNSIIYNMINYSIQVTDFVDKEKYFGLDNINSNRRNR